MKIFAFLLSFLLFTVVSQPSAHAVATSAVAVRIQLTAANVSAGTWTPLVTSTVKAIKGISLMNFSTQPLEVGIALAGAAANTEVRQLIAPQGAATANAFNGANAVLNPPVYYPMVTSQGVRISIRALNSAATAGEIDFTGFYN
jgi:hypothetical protein